MICEVIDPWPGTVDAAERYAALRHPALERVTVADDAGHTAVRRQTPGDQATRNAASLTDVNEILTAVGEIALGLEALHNAGLVHDHIDAKALVAFDARWVLLGVAVPGDWTAQRRDLAALGAVARSVLAPEAVASPGVATLLRSFQVGDESAAALGRTSLGLAFTPPPAPPPAVVPEKLSAPESAMAHSAADNSAEPGSGPAVGQARAAQLEASRRRTRNIMIAIAVFVVLIGALVLRAIDRTGIVTVPNEVGQSQRGAVSDLKNAGLFATVKSINDGGGDPAGIVISQSPSAGDKVRPGGDVTLEVSS